MNLCLTILPRQKTGPQLHETATLEVDVTGECGPPHAQLTVDGKDYFIYHDELMDFCAAVHAILQARRPRVSPY